MQVKDNLVADSPIDVAMLFNLLLKEKIGDRLLFHVGLTQVYGIVCMSSLLYGNIAFSSKSLDTYILVVEFRIMLIWLFHQQSSYRHWCC